MRSIKMFKGFTLVELMIVMGVVAVLSAISLFALSGARESARDARRKTDLETIRGALEMRKADCGAYPGSLGSSISGNASCTPTSVTYLSDVPGDPSSGNYYYNSSGTIFRLCARLENPGTAMSCPGCGPCNYRVNSQ